MFNTLCARRNLKFKCDRYTAGMVASAVYNTNRSSADIPMMTAFDFIRDERSSAELAEKQRITSVIKQVIGQLPSNTSPEKIQTIRAKTIASLKAQGRTDAEQLFNDSWPSLKPKE